MNEEEERIRRTIVDMKRQGVWPIRYSAAKKFSTNPALKSIRLSDDSKMTLKHHAVRTQKTNSNTTGRKNCVLCGKNRVIRNVRKYCGLCGDTVSLCRKIPEGLPTSCWTAWHSLDNLLPERKRRQDHLATEKQRKKSRKANNTSTNNGDDEEDIEVTARATPPPLLPPLPSPPLNLV